MKYFQNMARKLNLKDRNHVCLLASSKTPITITMAYFIIKQERSGCATYKYCYRLESNQSQKKKIEKAAENKTFLLKK